MHTAKSDLRLEPAQRKIGSQTKGTWSLEASAGGELEIVNYSSKGPQATNQHAENLWSRAMPHVEIGLSNRNHFGYARYELSTFLAIVSKFSRKLQSWELNHRE